MKQTEHYELNQWELSDRIRMEDFNADNAKIAAALAGKMGAWELLRTRDIQGSLNHSGPFLANRDWEPYNCVAIFFDVQVPSSIPRPHLLGLFAKRAVFWMTTNTRLRPVPPSFYFSPCRTTTIW